MKSICVSVHLAYIAKEAPLPHHSINKIKKNEKICTVFRVKFKNELHHLGFLLVNIYISTCIHQERKAVFFNNTS